MLAPCKESYDKLRQHMKKQRHHFDDKGHIVKAMLFPGVTREWNHKDNGAPKKWMFSNCGAGEGPRESLGLQGDQASQS